MVVARGCGTARQEGGVYLTIKTAISGQPIGWFLIDPPMKLTDLNLEINPLGINLVEHDGIYHIFDWVGSKHYPNVLDFVREAGLHGISRKISPSMDFSKLTSESRIFFAHERGFVENIESYETWKCPKEKLGIHLCHEPEDIAPNSCCVGIYWEDIDPKRGDYKVMSANERFVKRSFPSAAAPDTVYFARLRPSHIEPVYSAAVFASFSCQNLGIEVISAEDGSHVDRAGQIRSRTELPVIEVNE